MQISVTHVTLYIKQLVTWSKHSPATYHTFFLATMQNACTPLYTQYCKRCAASSNKQSNSHRETTNTYTANAVNWIQNPIDAFRIHVESLSIWIIYFWSLDRPPHSLYPGWNRRVQRPFLSTYVGRITILENPIR